MDSDLAPIPEEFYSFESNKPFDTCVVCKADLLTGEIDYFIEKSVRNYREHDVTDIVYEYAICWNCTHKMNGQMSEDSTQNIQNYFSDQSLFMQNVNEYNRNWQQQEGSLLPDKCVLTGESKLNLDEYMIYGHFRGNTMVKSSMPCLLSGKVLDALSELLSNQTIDQLDDFMGEYFGGPPEFEELLKPRRPVFF